MSPELALFSAALGLSSPWQVVRVTFDQPGKELHLYVDFPAGSRFACPVCSAPCSVYDSEPDRVWRHLNFFEYKTYLHARYPRVSCKDCGVKTVEGSWTRQGSGFTLLFEAFVLVLCRQMPVLAAATFLGENDTRLWHLVGHYIDKAQATQDLSQVRHAKVDETARSSGHEYVTLFADADTARVVLVTEGKDASTVDTFNQELQARGGTPDQIESISLDMSPAFESGVTRCFPKALQVVDRFHVVKMANDSVDRIRRAEVREHPELKKTRYLFLKNPEHLTAKQQQTIDHLCLTQPELHTVQAYQCKLSLQRLWTLPDRASAAAYLEQWCEQSASALSDLVATIRKQWDRILNYFTAGHQTNGLMEGLNSLVQATKARARGFRTDQYMRWIIYLVTGKLNFGLPTPISG